MDFTSKRHRSEELAPRKGRQFDIRSKTHWAPQIVPIARDDRANIILLPCSRAQQRLWFIDQLEGGSAAYQIPFALRLRGELNLRALQEALDRIVARHEILRTVFLNVDGEPMQRITREGNFKLQLIEVCAQSEEERQAQVRSLEREELLAPFDLSVGPLLRGRLLRLAVHEHVLLITMHHMISDGWSVSVLRRELAILYVATLEGKTDPLPPLPIQYGDYAHWQQQWMAQQEPHLRRQVQYWKEHLQGAPELLELPTDRPRPAIQSYAGSSAPVSLGTTLTADVISLSRRLNLTVAMTLYAAWSVVLTRVSGQEDIVVGMPVANRSHPELQGLIGLFINTVAVRIRFDDDPPVGDLLQRVKGIMFDAYSHQDAPFEQVVEVLQPVRSRSHSPIFQVMFALNVPGTTLQLPGLQLLEEEVPWQTAQFDLMLSLQEFGADIVGMINYATDLFDAQTMQRWAAYFKTILRQMVSAPAMRVSQLQLMSDSERRQVTQIFNTKHAPYPQEKLLHQLFEEQVERAPNAVAASFEGQAVTYAQLNVMANQLAWYLRGKGAGPDQLVALCIERSLDLVVGLVGILKAGAGYLPLDPNYPPERLQYMLEDAAPALLVTQARTKERLGQTTVGIIAIDEDWREIALASARNLDVEMSGLQPHHLAYVIYTSGSTGKPKGVMVEHRNVTRLFAATAHWFRFGPQDVWTLFHSFAFDFSVWELWGALLYGGRVVIVPHLIARSPRDFYQLLCEQHVTVLNQTPSAFVQLIDAQANSAATLRHSLRVVIFGGEALELHTLQPWVQHNGVEQPQLVNMYGITETTVHVTYRRLTEQEIESERGSMIGRPIPDLQVYILGRDRRPVPIGVVGEMYVGGAGVTRGYLYRPELTSERFIPDSLSTDSTARLYKTGDLARWRSDGTLEYLGRNDHQVKIRGFRIELGEIDAQLVRDARVKEAVVIAREDAPGEKRLVAYIVPVDLVSAATAEDLRRQLKATLPEYMVPSAFVMLDRLPLTSNGKLDRRALPAPELGAYASGQYEPPRGDVEEILAGIWQSLLRVERVGRQDNFFELGGHSLLIVQMMERLRRVGFAVEVRRVFESPTLADLAAALTSEVIEQFEVPPNLIPAGCTDIAADMLPLAELEPEYIASIVASVPGGAANVQDIYPLAPLQEGILFHHLMNEQGGDSYVLPVVLCVSSRERLDALIAALQAVIDRHDVLRTAVLWADLPRPMQVVYRTAHLPIREVELDPAREPTDHVKAWLRPERQRLNLRQAPLMRLQVAEDKNRGEWYVLWQLHHILDDATSLRLVIAEIIAHLEGRAQHLPAPVPYRNHVAQSLAYARKHDAQVFFRTKLGDVVESTAPFDLLNVHGDGSNILDSREELDRELARRVREQARRHGVSAATLFHAAWAMVVAHTSRRDDVVFGSVLLGRLQGSAGAQRTIGMFINTLPLRLKLQRVTARELVEQTQRELVELLNHEQASLAAAQRCSGIEGSAPLFTALLNYRHSVIDTEADWSSTSGIRIVAGQERTNYPVTLSVDDFGEGFTLSASTDARIDPQRLTGYLHTAVKSLVQALEQAPHSLALSLKILPEAERRQLIGLLNATQADYERDRRVHELFEDQVRRTPEVVAVLYGQQALTYAELNRKANQLARYLRDKGVGVDDPVGICVERGLEMGIGLLGVLKAGAAYLPLDPSYPRARLQYMVQDAAPKVVLTQDRLRALLPPTDARVIALDADMKEFEPGNPENLSPDELGLKAANLVYVIYTSGSTGRPKGTTMSHSAVSNLIQWHRRNERLGEARRVLQFAALSFDVAFQETFSTLCTGGTLVMLDEWMRKDARALIALLKQQSIERLFVPPLMLQSLAECCETSETELDRLRDVITAGEQLRITPEITRFFARLNDCRLHNHYGPTETHVVTALQLAGEPARWRLLPTIGRPIGNTHVYILDERKQPTPMGVAGDMYIGGANLARGYLGRAALTAERFVADPFSTEPGRLYRTGDMGRWLADGTIEYIGRNDDQVKIRGFRIELGEIEAQLILHAQVKEAAVVSREATLGQKRLVAYVTPTDQSRPPNAEDLRAHLKGALPDHMIPSAFVVLESLPLTSSGKLNRRALPAPELEAYTSREYETPRGEIEEILADIWQSVLEVERVGRNDSFFELGGHSLLVLSVLFKINRAFHAEMRVTDIYSNPTLLELAQRIAGAAVKDEFVDLQPEAQVPEDIVAYPGAVRCPAKAILLTGATGFVGRFLLAELLKDSDSMIYCLVRGETQDEAAARLRATLAKWDLWQDEFGQRIVVLVGDLRQRRLGLNDSAYRMLCKSIDCIYHCGASMNHLETYTMAKQANVEAARELLRLATEQRPKLINYISTFGVFSPVLSKIERVVDELSPIDHESHRHSQGYAASKWVSEKIFLTASQRGIPCNIFRMGLLWADSQLGRYDDLQRECRLLKSCLLSGYGIRDYRYDTMPAPVDYAARAVVFLANKHNQGLGIFHVSGSERMSEGLFERCNEVPRISLDLVPYYEWIRQIRRLHYAGQSLPVVPLLEFAFEMDEESFSEYQRNLRATAIRVDSARTRRELEEGGIIAPHLNHKSLAACIESLRIRDAEIRNTFDVESLVVAGTCAREDCYLDRSASQG